LVFTFIAPFVGSPYPVVRSMLTLAEVKPGDLVYDMGCGDGRMVVMAAQEFGARAVGIELREDLAKKAMEKVKEEGLEGRVKIVNRDMFTVSIGDADVVTLYLTTSANTQLLPKLESELRKGTRVVSHDYEILKWNPVKVNKFCENPTLGYPSHTIYLYRK